VSPYAHLSRHYRRLDPNTLDRGTRWYPQARALMERLASDTGYTLDQAVAVLAITSPAAQLTTNLRWTREALESGGTARVGRFPNSMAPKIQAVLADPAAATEYVRGPKVGPFFQAILGDNDALVIDRWAAYAAGHSDRDAVPDAESRRGIESAYRRLATRVGMSVRDLQAAIWIHVRESTARGGGTVPRLADIV
jgi:hypothetical protein